MFDTHILHQHRGTHFIDRNVTINEHRAPTDKSVALLKEMEQAAEDKLICRGEVKDNLLSAQWDVFEDYMTMRLRCIVRVKLNGKEHLLKFYIDRATMYEEHAVYDVILEKLSSLVAKEIFMASSGNKPAMQTIWRK